ncbi:hypothetical protein D3C73_1646110 [compost metagenome]
MPTVRDALLEPIETNDMGFFSINGRDELFTVTSQVVEAIDLGVKFVNDTLLLPDFLDDHLQFL